MWTFYYFSGNKFPFFFSCTYATIYAFLVIIVDGRRQVGRARGERPRIRIQMTLSGCAARGPANLRGEFCIRLPPGPSPLSFMVRRSQRAGRTAALADRTGARADWPAGAPPRVQPRGPLWGPLCEPLPPGLDLISHLQ